MQCKCNSSCYRGSRAARSRFCHFGDCSNSWWFTNIGCRSRPPYSWLGSVSLHGLFYNTYKWLHLFNVTESFLYRCLTPIASEGIKPFDNPLKIKPSSNIDFVGHHPLLGAANIKMWKMLGYMSRLNISYY